MRRLSALSFVVLLAAVLAGSAGAKVARQPTEAAPRVAVAPPVPDFLRDDFMTTQPMRALQIVEGDAYLTAKGAALGKTSHKKLPDALELVAIDDGATTGRPRVVVEGNNVRVALYLEPANLAEVAVTGTAIFGSPALVTSSAPETPRVTLRAGERVKAGPVKKGHRTAHWAGDDLTTDGHVAADKVSRVYTPEAALDGNLSPGGYVTGKLAIYDGPKGRVLATLTLGKDDMKFVELLGATKGGRSLMRLPLADAVVVGWVATSRIGELGDMGGQPGIGVGHIGKSRRTPAVIDPAHGLTQGTLLYDAPSGDAIGVVTWDFTIEPEESKDGWARYAIPTDFGTAPLWTPRP